jgi:hypothetical protein
MNPTSRRAIDMNRKTIVTLVRAVIAAALIVAGLDLARAEATPAGTTTPKAGAARPSVVPSPKGDGSQMNPMRRTQNVDRQKAANSAAERKKANEAAGAKSAPPKG